MAESMAVLFTEVSCYAVYILVLLLCVFSLNKIDRFALAVLSQPMAQDIKFGDKGCLPYNSTFSYEYKEFCVKGLDDSSEPETNQTT